MKEIGNARNMQAQIGGCPLSITGIGQKLGDEEQRGPWAFHVCRNPQLLQQELADILGGTIRT